MTAEQHALDDARSEDTPQQALSPKFLHDLRTPVNQIIGYSEMLTEQAEEEGQPGFLPDLQEIHDAALQLLGLLNNGTTSATDTPATLSPEAQPIPSKEPAALDASHALILVVDDNRRNRDMLSRRLIKQGYGVAMAEDGRKAMEAVRAQPFDLVLLDIMMPELDGYEVLQQLKADETLRHVPVIMISALHELDSVVRCIKLGAEDYLCKPFEPTLLKARIGASLEKKHALDMAQRFTAELQENYKRLQELEKLRDDLTHMIIHDLRTPLSSVIMGMQTLDVVGDLNEEQHEMMDIAINGGEILLGMINDLLDVEKMESGVIQLDYAELSAAELVSAAIAQVASLAESKQLTLIQQIAADLPPLQGDENKLQRTLVNLLGNAIKFTPSGGTVTVEARHSTAEEAIIFEVMDTGEGIPIEAFDRIFEKFGQVQSRQGGRVMSTGLGLTFCKLAVEAHGGHIGVESTQGGGSTFCFALPVGSTKEQADVLSHRGT